MQNNLSLSAVSYMDGIWKALKECGLPVHSFLADQGGRCIAEHYHEPYGPNDLHRMFSVTKSFCSLAIGSLLADGKLSLEDHIVDYFPEYCLETIHPWLQEMTIRQMLSMETCYTSTTYKVNMQSNWVESFFTTQPDHRSGQIFQYDTSSSHTLAALVKKLTGKGVLDYLREKFLDEIGFSKEAYIVKDPFGSEMGGSGLMAYPSDILKVGRYCLDTIQKGEGVFADYLRQAVSFQVPTVHSGQTIDEQQGYGYQFWQIRRGFSMYGMGGQYMLAYPQLDLVVVVTADTQNFKGGYQRILDLIYEHLTPLFQEISSQDNGFKQEPLMGWEAPALFSLRCRILPNGKGFTSMSLAIEEKEGSLTLKTEDQTFMIPFAFDALRISQIEKYHQRIAVKACWAAPNTLYLPVQIVGECVGSIHMLIHLEENNASIYMRKIEETYFNEFQGFFEAEKA